MYQNVCIAWHLADVEDRIGATKKLDRDRGSTLTRLSTVIYRSILSHLSFFTDLCLHHIRHKLSKMRGLSSSMIASSSSSSSRPFVRLAIQQSRPAIAAPYPVLARKASSRSSPTKPSLNVGSASGGPQDPLAYCSSLVQRLDPEAWLTSYFWKGRERAWYLAWRAFNVCLISSHSIAHSTFESFESLMGILYLATRVPGLLDNPYDHGSLAI